MEFYLLIVFKPRNKISRIREPPKWGFCQLSSHKGIIFPQILFEIKRIYLQPQSHGNFDFCLRLERMRKAVADALKTFSVVITSCMLYELAE